MDRTEGCRRVNQQARTRVGGTLGHLIAVARDDHHLLALGEDDAQRRQQLAAQTRPLKKELEQNEQRMTAITQEKTALEAQLSAPLPPAEIAEAGRRLKALSDEMDALEERWMVLSEQLQQMQA